VTSYDLLSILNYVIYFAKFMYIHRNILELGAAFWLHCKSPLMKDLIPFQSSMYFYDLSDACNLGSNGFFQILGIHCCFWFLFEGRPNTGSRMLEWKPKQIMCCSIDKPNRNPITKQLVSSIVHRPLGYWRRLWRWLRRQWWWWLAGFLKKFTCMLHSLNFVAESKIRNLLVRIV
jgi:hypothetical protein